MKLFRVGSDHAIRNVAPEQAEVVLAGLEDPDEVRPLLLHPDDSTGGLMTSEFLVLRRRMTVAEALQAIQDSNPRPKPSIIYLKVEVICRFLPHH